MLASWQFMNGVTLIGKFAYHFFIYNCFKRNSGTFKTGMSYKIYFRWQISIRYVLGKRNLTKATLYYEQAS